MAREQIQKEQGAFPGLRENHADRVGILRIGQLAGELRGFAGPIHWLFPICPGFCGWHWDCLDAFRNPSDSGAESNDLRRRSPGKEQPN